MKIAAILGTRPELIKMQPVIQEIRARGHELIFVHTGQHFDFEMSDIFVNELELPSPDYFLKVKSSSQGIQTGKIIAKCENILKIEKPEIILVEGDTNSALGASIASSKLNIPIGHVEAGCRSFDKSMSEEVNRVLISDIANLHFVPTNNCRDNLLREGIDDSKIYLTGHPIVDLIKKIEKKIPQTVANLKTSYSLVTIHRRENITNKERIRNILVALDSLSHQVKLVFPCHPHTRSQILKYGLTSYLNNIHVMKPVGYLDSLGLIKHAQFVLTDSGGIQQEACILRTPCITLRCQTEWIETIEAGINFLSGYITSDITKTVGYVESHYDAITRRFKSRKQPFGRAGVSRRVTRLIESTYGRN